MALKDQTIGHANHGPRCRVGTLLAALPVEDAHTLTAWMADEAIESTGIMRALKAEYADTRPELVLPARDSIARHRKGDCGCGTR